MNPLLIHAGPVALTHLRQHGLRASDIAMIPAAAGGPKGLIFQHLDQWLFGSWLPTAPRVRTLIGASIGGWRMAAACDPDPVAAFAKLSALYCERQRYPHRPSAAYVSAVCGDILDALVGGREQQILTHPHYRLQLLVARGAGLLAAPQRHWSTAAGFAAAGIANLISRDRLARQLQRVLMSVDTDTADWLRPRFDGFDTQFAPLNPENLQAALLASGTLPFVMEPVRSLPDAPSGCYWDGGLVDYHLALPYSRVENGLVLYPHFSRHITPGWLDKGLPWRRAARGPNRCWLANVVMLSPSPEFLRTLPRGKLPDRTDFAHYGLDHDLRIREWQRAIAEGERLRDAIAAFAERPDMDLVQPL